MVMAGKIGESGVLRGPMRSGVDPKRGFTLIELLVVISIISLLVSILLPSLTRAKDLARRVICLSNVRRLALAGRFYLVDNKYIFPPVRMKYKSDGSVYINEYGRTKPRWQWFLDQGVGPVIEPGLYGGDFGDAQTTTMTNEYFLCPSMEGEYARDIRNGPYGYNYQYLGDSRAVSGGVYTNFPVRESEIKAASQTVFIADSRGGDPNHGKHSYTVDPPKLATSKGVLKFGPTAGKDGPIGHSPVEARHVERGSVSFVDGHAESMTLKQLGYEVDSDGVVTPGLGNNRLWSGTDKDE